MVSLSQNWEIVLVFNMIRNKIKCQEVLCCSRLLVTHRRMPQLTACACDGPECCTGTGRIVLLWWFMIGVCTVLRSFADLGMQV